jgi:subtilisin family serine protease
VTASTDTDEPKIKNGPDDWGSSHGKQVDIAAPGVRLRTTTAGGQGSSALGPSYVDDFFGTSAAAAIVAGAAALIRSANPRLGEAEVRRILKQNADRVGSIEYDAGQRNDRMGSGRLNVLKAVQEALDIKNGARRRS